MTDLAERLQELAAANAEPIPPEVAPLSDSEAKEAFLSALEEGKTVPEAAETAQRTIRWFRNRRQRGTRVYDVDFTLAYDEIMEPGGANGESLGWRGLANLAKASDRGDTRASEKLAANYHKDFGWMKQEVARGGLNVEQLQVFFGELSLQQLLELKNAREATKPKELPVIDQ